MCLEIITTARAVPENMAAPHDFGPNVRVLDLNAQMKAVMTIIRSQDCSADQFRFYADRVTRFVVESGLAEVPCTFVGDENAYAPCTATACGAGCTLSVEVIDRTAIWIL